MTAKIILHLLIVAALLATVAWIVRGFARARRLRAFRLTRTIAGQEPSTDKEAQTVVRTEVLKLYHDGKVKEAVALAKKAVNDPWFFKRMIGPNQVGHDVTIAKKDRAANRKTSGPGF